jgi:hypothetical protein
MVNRLHVVHGCVAQDFAVCTAPFWLRHCWGRSISQSCYSPCQLEVVWLPVTSDREKSCPPSLVFLHLICDESPTVPALQVLTRKPCNARLPTSKPSIATRPLWFPWAIPVHNNLKIKQYLNIDRFVKKSYPESCASYKQPVAKLKTSFSWLFTRTILPLTEFHGSPLPIVRPMLLSRL